MLSSSHAGETAKTKQKILLVFSLDPHAVDLRTPHLAVFTHRFVGFLLPGVFGRSAWIGAHLHMHGVDDVEEVFHHSHALQGRVVLGRIPI